MKYNKLVRDKIPEIIISQGRTPLTHIAEEAEYWQKLKEKLQEELDEFFAAETIEEIADIMEVLEAICDYKIFDQTELLALKDKKAGERGRFKLRVILEES